MPEGVDKQDLAAQYGYALSFLKSDKSLWDLFNAAVKEGYTSAQFAAKFRATPFYQKHSATYRQAIEKKTVDPASWDEAVRNQTASILDRAGSMGVNITAKVANRLANDVIMHGWTESELNDRMSGYIETVAGTHHYGGKAGDTEEELRATAMNMGQRMSDTTVKSWVRNIARGDATVNDFEAQMRGRAESQFPGYTDQIRQGLTVKDIADPFRESMAHTLELNPANIDMFDAHIQKALKAHNADTGKKGEFSMADFELGLRKDPRWASTKNARDQMSSVANEILKNFGFRG